ncbi:probable nucleolar protein 5-1 isoform X1 [Triticum aestivum]|uniref:probable nucleolar protein 5-1 isoform X1 n=1 Tax=Triticum aestivum TaxID=4565 RepID=UPI001D008154|nr:probable nucleolar protein 5-1 isoform X1 [Triticum aestivum]
MGRRRGPCSLLLQWRGLTVLCKRKRRRTRGRGKKSTSTSTSTSTSENASFTTAAESIPRTGTDPNHGETILVLFETPSGFAIFCFKEDYLKEPNIWEIFGEHFRTKGIVWLKEFQIFKDKSSAIDNGTGVSRELTEMISRCHHPCQKLAVGKPEYKTIIETSLPGVHCLFDETVMEVMWGLKHLMHSLVPQEKLTLTKEDRLPMSQGLKMFLYHYGFDVKPELVNEQVVNAACLLRDAGLIMESHSEQLRWAAGQLKEVSGINPEGWSAMKTATALTIMFDTVEITDDEMEVMFCK